VRVHINSGIPYNRAMTRFIAKKHVLVDITIANLYVRVSIEIALCDRIIKSKLLYSRAW